MTTLDCYRGLIAGCLTDGSSGDWMLVLDPADFDCPKDGGGNWLYGFEYHSQMLTVCVVWVRCRTD